MRPYESYIICTAPRSGSTLLCRLLAASGVAGEPESYFHRPSLAEWFSAHDLEPDPTLTRSDDVRRVFRAAICKGRGQTPVFGLRLQRHSIEFFIDQLRLIEPNPATDPARVEAIFGRTLFIHLTRPNKLEQAISLLRAEQSGLWHRAPDGTEIQRLAPPTPPQYDPERIQSHIDELTAFDAQWAEWFQTENLTPHRITYDDLAADPRATLANLLSVLGLDPAHARSVTPGTAKLADALSRDWANRFRSDRPT